MDQTEKTDTPSEQNPAPKATPHLTQLAKALISSYDKEEPHLSGERISVNPVVSKFASWYEKLRNVMEYREEEMMLRAAVERILRRMLLLGGNANTTARPLVRELIWARYLPDNEVPETIVEKVEQAIDLHLRLRLLVIQRHKIAEQELNDLMYQLISVEIAHILHPNHEKETMCNFMFHVLKDDVVIADDTIETKDAQVYIAIRKAFAKDDLAFLRYHLLQLYFGKLTEASLQTIAKDFMQGYQELHKQIKYPRKERIYGFIKKRSAAFLILEDVLRTYKGKIHELVTTPEQLEQAVYSTCDEKYSAVSSKVQRAVIRSFFFILLTKVIFAFAIEGTYERVVYGHILWTSLLINTSVPPLLLLLVSIFIRTPGPENTVRIHQAIKTLLYTDNPRLGQVLTIQKRAAKPSLLFSALWFLAFLISFGAIIYVLRLIGFNSVSIGIFLFFLAIVSFLAYRISLTAHLYRMGERQGILTPFVDFFFMPVVQVGQRLTTNISKINILLFVFDFFIETPFKLLFAFFEQWFVFLHAKREELE